MAGNVIQRDIVEGACVSWTKLDGVGQYVPIAERHKWRLYVCEYRERGGGYMPSSACT